MRLWKFRVQNYRSVIDSGWIEVNQVTAFVGPNESGKSNLFDALYRVNPYINEETYDISEDWPADKWGAQDKEQTVCSTVFIIDDEQEIRSLFTAAAVPAQGQEAEPEGEQEDGESDDATGTIVGVGPESANLPTLLHLNLSRRYTGTKYFDVSGAGSEMLDGDKMVAWAVKNTPKFVSIAEYDLPGTRTELPPLAEKRKKNGWSSLSPEEQTIMIVLELSRIDINDFIKKGDTPEGRTLRSFDKRLASAYLTQQFARLWRQKNVRFDIEIDATTLNIFVEDVGFGMPVRLSRRSTGFRWHVSFAWKFTHASNGEYKNCILLLEEPGIHLHHDGQRDLLTVFEDLSNTNTVLYTTHLPTMVDPANPERVRIVEVHSYHTKVIKGVVSSQRRPMAVIEARLGLAGDMGGLLGNRQTLIVEGGDDALILQKLSGVLLNSNRTGLSDRIYLWPAEGAPKTPMYAGFMVGQKWDAGVLLDSDEAGETAKKKISELYLKDLAAGAKFRVFMLREATGMRANEIAIEDIFPRSFYLDCVNKAYGVAITEADLPQDGSSLITKRVERVLRERHGRSELDKRIVMAEMLKQFDGWSKVEQLPKEVGDRAEKLFQKINAAFAD